jgi:hypothetical protein
MHLRYYSKSLTFYQNYLAMSNTTNTTIPLKIYIHIYIFSRNRYSLDILWRPIWRSGFFLCTVRDRRWPCQPYRAGRRELWWVLSQRQPAAPGGPGGAATPRGVSARPPVTPGRLPDRERRRRRRRSGGNTPLLRKRSRVRFPHSANICVHEHDCLYWVCVFLCMICMYLTKNVYKYDLSVI